ncbi:DUF7527 domain-containing protein [Halorarum halobium]|uniref:DUF7527 domain-containing protein n=1 Tax=Halorarum halobium TaxID=3075121 RepID=UPI0028AF2AF6|nr:hypothetical protein [Halobaculum sp. XH14]
MDSETIETVTGWSSEPYSGGYGGLHELADREFTGAVTDGTAWLFVLNGRVVGAADGTIESFEDADGTAYAAPDPSLPLLFAMRERGGETKAKYYTNDTPLSEADATLSAGNFTGFVELSENVLSGDYYVVYHGGRRLACAFVGTQRELLTDDEAFERADDEVGIYEVRTVDVDVIDVPEPEPEPDPDPTLDTEPESAAEPEPDDSGGSDLGTAGGGGGGTAAAIDEAEDPEEAASSNEAEEPSEADASDEAADAGDAGPGSVTIDPDAGGGEAVGETATGRDAAEREHTEETTAPSTPSGSESEPEAGVDAEPDDVDEEPAAEAGSADASPAAVSASDEDDDGSATAASERPARREESKERKRQRDAEPTDAVAAAESDPFSAEEQWRETTAIPSLDPDETRAADPDGADAQGRSASTSAADRPSSAARRNRTDGSATAASGTDDARSGRRSEPEPSPESERPPEADRAAESESGEDDDASGEDGDAVESATLRRDLQRARSAKENAAEELASTREELSTARSEVERLTEENERLEGRIETLQSDLADARSQLSESAGSSDAAGGRSISPSRALEGTNLFVRYESKGEGTLEKVHAGNATREEVDENLRLEVHTEFDAADAVVGGTAYGEWLEDTIEYGFVEWVVRTLLYEIRETGSRSSMRALYDAIPKIDRAELDAVVDLVDEQGKKNEERSFDVVLRDRMGDPLVVANVTDSRTATTESMLDGLVGGASSVADQNDGLAAAFHVTSSFFEPGALEAVADATGGGLLNRNKNKSFVKLSRKRGFHLCLVESREGEFHVNVPEL